MKHILQERAKHHTNNMDKNSFTESPDEGEQDMCTNNDRHS